jgi:hypothetical protein
MAALDAINKAEADEVGLGKTVDPDQIGDTDSLGIAGAADDDGEIGIGKSVDADDVKLDDSDIDPTDNSEPADLGDMADEIRDMADELSNTDKDELGLESFDNTPEPEVRKTNPLDDFANVLNKVREFDYTPPNSASNPMKAEEVESSETAIQESESDPLESVTAQLFKDYKEFIES